MLLLTRFARSAAIMHGFSFPFKYEMPGPGEFLKLFVHKGTQQLACLVIIQGGCSTCPQTIHSLGPRLSLFSEVSYSVSPEFMRHAGII